MVLLVWKLKQPSGAIVPSFLPWYSDRCAWQASSITARLCLRAMAMIRSRWQG